MKAVFKDNKRLLVKNISKEERVLINTFVDKFNNYNVSVTELMDIDNQLDGMTFTITEDPRNKIGYKEPFNQILVQDTLTNVDLEIDNQTDMYIRNDYLEALTTTVDRSVVKIYANEIKSLEGTTKQYTIYAILNKEGCEQTTVPINITVIYRKDVGVTNYNDLDNLPKINKVTVIQEKTLGQYGIQGEMKYVSNAEILDIIDNIFN